MVKVDLITGFLGAGKTTFLMKYASYFLEKGMNIGILENDYGAVNVDMMLLQDIEGENCTLEMVSGGCDSDCHRRRFKTKLIAMGMSGYDRVIIEPSGIFDMDEFFDALHEEPLNRWFEIGSVITIVDSTLENDLSKQSQYLLASQIANTGCVVFSKVQNMKDTNIDDVICMINHTLETYKCTRRIKKEDEKVIIKDWNEFEDRDFFVIENAGYQCASIVKEYDSDKNSYESLYYMNKIMPVHKLCEITENIFKDPECGEVIRIKGFMPKEDGSYVKINATKENVELTDINRGQEIIIVIGEQLDKGKIGRYFE